MNRRAHSVADALRQRPVALTAAVALLAITLLCIAGPWFVDWRFDAIDFDGSWSAPPSAMHWFGTDSLGRDLYVRTLVGGRISLAVGLVGTLVSLLIGVAYGAVAGYVGGRVDALMMRAVDVLYALPFLFLVILLMLLFGRHLLLVFVAIGAINWLDMARIVRGETRALKARDFVSAAIVSGVSPSRIVAHHIVLNLLGVVVVYATLTVPQVILMEAFLSFLGLGVQAPATSWGALVADGARDMELAPAALIFPALFLGASLLSLNLLGDALRDALDPRQHR